MKSYSLQELNEHLRRVVALNFSEALWVRCEIAQVGESRGHFFLELVEKEENIIAKASAIIWDRTFRRLQREHGRGIRKVVQEGLEVMFKMRIEFHEVYGFRYFIENLDPDFTLGKLAMRKQAIIEAFKKEDLLGKNNQIPLPQVLQKIAIISSQNAAGYQDYLTQLKENAFGYVVDNQLFATAMQGDNVEEELLFQLKKIRLRKEKYDAVVIIRGGGARLDLLAFDNEKISRAVANFPIPVLTGIGHDIDESILDKVAHTALKTPTAVADFIINHNLFFENRLLQIGNELNYIVQEKMQEHYFFLQNLQQALAWEIQSFLKNKNQEMESVNHELQQVTTSFLQRKRQQVTLLEEIFKVLSPEATLKRGFSITSINGKIIKSIKDINSQKEQEITTQLSDGSIKTKTQL